MRTFFPQNSMRAVVEHHGSDSTELPNVEVLIAKGKNDITVQVSQHVLEFNQ